MKYISLFSGIGGFEVGIHRASPRAKCVFFSEISPDAIQVYTKHFPKHDNAGDITKLTNAEIKRRVQAARGCDLIVGGSPCVNLSLLSAITGDTSGIHTKDGQSKLFFDMLRVIRAVRTVSPNVHVILENVANCSLQMQNELTKHLRRAVGGSHVWCTRFDASLVSMQARVRNFWTTFPVALPTIPNPRITWKSVLEPMSIARKQHHMPESRVQRENKFDQARYGTPAKMLTKPTNQLGVYKSTATATATISLAWRATTISDTICPRSKTIIKGQGFGNMYLRDRRFLPKDCFRIRTFSVHELERLFGFPDGYCNYGTDEKPISIPIYTAKALLGNSVVTQCVEHVVREMV